MESLKYPDFRVLGLANLFNSFGMMGEQVALGWFVLELTNSPFMVAFSIGLRMSPMFLFGIPAGSVADIVDRRHFIRLLNLALALPTAAIALLILLEVAQLWHVLALSFIVGSLHTFHLATRASLAYDIVGPSLGVQGLALITLTLRLGGMVGSIVAGLVTAHLGSHFAFFAIAASYLLSATVLFFFRFADRPVPKISHSMIESLKGYIREARTNRTLLTMMILTGLVEMLGFSYQALLPSLARDVLGVGADGLGILDGLRAIGGTVGIAILVSRSHVGRKGLSYISAVLMFACLLIVLGFAPNYFVALLIVIAINAMQAFSDILSQSLILLSVPGDLRGRAMGSWVLAVGAGPIGRLQIGALASVVSVPFALTFNGVALVLLTIIVVLLFPRVTRL